MSATALVEICKSKASKRTTTVKKILRNMARNWGFKLNPRVRGHREFLCDFVWVRYQRYHKLQLREVGLVAECEWSTKPKSIVYDFRKLMPLKPRLKLCVYQVKGSTPEATAEKCRNEIALALKHYEDHRQGECYFLLEIHRSGHEPNGKPRLWYWSVSSDGSNLKPRFVQFQRD